jgi:hypothetical protein
MDAFNMKRVIGDGNCLLRGLALLLENDEIQYGAVRQETLNFTVHVCDNWNKFKEYVILTRDGYMSVMSQDRLYGVL